MRYAAYLIVLAFAVSLAAAQIPLPDNEPVSRILIAMDQLCLGMKSLLPVAAMLMILLSGVIYALGQMMGAETRARANVWATSALTGALIAVLIAVVAPAVLTSIYGYDYSLIWINSTYHPFCTIYQAYPPTI